MRRRASASWPPCILLLAVLCRGLPKQRVALVLPQQGLQGGAAGSQDPRCAPTCAGMWAPGLVGVVVGAILLLVVRDSPESVGFPPVEVVEAAKQDDGQDAPKESLLSMLVNNVLRNPFIWGMALTYFFIYVVRQGVTSWFVFYLIKVGAAQPFLRSHPCHPWRPSLTLQALEGAWQPAYREHHHQPLHLTHHKTVQLHQC